MNTAISVPAGAVPAPRHIGLRILLGVAALLEAYNGLSVVTDLLIPGHKASGLDGAIARAHLAVHPVLALAALLFVLIGRLRDATIVLGALALVAWLNEMPSVVQHGFDFGSSYTALQTTAQIIAFPLIAACGIAYAARNQRPAISAALVSTPTLFMVLFHAVSIVVFAIGVMMYGF
ncbi:hypothetical protein JQ628_22705 [Bradyrhizobium lablabi]|uniref:hypothetical protein n=1 Tax=Bradyrhizobium lablabi TaxID=722472 RepID=UPI001BAABABC|nr:hypothetical protein [Bradyrhizobium lablabi]MBR1124356.1 hypothetical protein [Bradyrhizobium lablabi]